MQKLPTLTIIDEIDEEGPKITLSAAGLAITITGIKAANARKTLAGLIEIVAKEENKRRPAQ